MCLDLTHAPVATTARAAATGPVSMSNPEAALLDDTPQYRPGTRYQHPSAATSTPAKRLNTKHRNKAPQHKTSVHNTHTKNRNQT